MKILRSIVNKIFKNLASNSSVKVKNFDLSVLKILSKIGVFLGIRQAQILSEEWFYNYLQIIMKAIADSKYGEEISFPCPLVVSLSVHDLCNFECGNCYADSSGHGDATVLNHDITLELSKSLTPIFIITGGEPFQRQDLFELLEPLLKNKKELIIATHCPCYKTLDKMLPYAKQITILVSVWCSGSADNIEAFDSFCSGSSFDRILNMRFSVSLNYICSFPTEEDFSRIETYLDKYTRLHRVYFSRKILVGRFQPDRNCNKNEITDEHYCKIRELQKKYPQKFIPTLPELNAIVGKISNSVVCNLLGIKIHSGCGAGVWTFHIGPDGFSYPCFACEKDTQLIKFKHFSLTETWSSVKASGKISCSGHSCMAEYLFKNQ